MDTDTYTTEGSRLETVILSLVKEGTVSLLDAIAIFEAIASAANDRPIDGARWIKVCQSLLTKSA